DEAAGKKTKCPKCGATVTLPAAHGEPIYEAEPLADAGAPGGGVDPYAVENPYQAPQPAGPGSDEQRRPCPVCGEMILANAAKCRFCGEVFDPALKKAKKAKASDAEMSTGDWVVAVLCSGIGCIAGIVWMIQGKPKGAKMFGISLLFVVLWNIISFAIQSVNK